MSFIKTTYQDGDYERDVFINTSLIKRITSVSNGNIVVHYIDGSEEKIFAQHAPAFLSALEEADRVIDATASVSGGTKPQL